MYPDAIPGYLRNVLIVTERQQPFSRTARLNRNDRRPVWIRPDQKGQKQAPLPFLHLIVR